LGHESRRHSRHGSRWIAGARQSAPRLRHRPVVALNLLVQSRPLPRPQSLTEPKVGHRTRADKQESWACTHDNKLLFGASPHILILVCWTVEVHRSPTLCASRRTLRQKRWVQGRAAPGTRGARGHVSGISSIAFRAEGAVHRQLAHRPLARTREDSWLRPKECLFLACASGTRVLNGIRSRR
jgi:hypothetical protein